MSPPEYLDNCIEIVNSRRKIQKKKSNKAGNAIAAISKV